MRGWVLFLTIVCVSSFLFFFRLGERPLRNPDEGRYAEIAKEMVERRDWVEPRLYGVDYLKKPVLFYWLIALSFQCFGFTEWAARLVPAFFGVIGVLAAFLFARRIFGEKTAFWSSLILVSNFWYLQVGRYLVIDMVFSFFVVSALYAFYLAATEAKFSRLTTVIFYACVSLSFLAKGFIGLIIPFITIAVYALLTGQVGRVLRRMRWVTGFVVCALLVAPWMFEIAKREPEFLSFFFFHENMARFISSSFEHQGPWYFYYGFMLVVLIPWIFFLTPLKHSLTFSNPATRHKKLFLLISGAALVVFFSFSKGKLATYILPSIPFLSIVIADGWVTWESEGWKVKSWKQVASPLLFLIFFSLVFLWVLPIYADRHPGDFVRETLPCLRWLGVIAAAGAAAGLFWVLKRDTNRLFYTLILMFVAASFPVQAAMERSNPNYTTKHFAEALNPLMNDKDLVVIYGNPGALYDFRFYLDKPVQAIGLEGELQFAREDGDTDAGEQYISKEEFYKMFFGQNKVYCLTRRTEIENLPSEFQKNMTVIKEDKRKILFYLNAPLKEVVG